MEAIVADSGCVVASSPPLWEPVSHENRLMDMNRLRVAFLAAIVLVEFTFASCSDGRSVGRTSTASSIVVTTSSTVVTASSDVVTISAPATTSDTEVEALTTPDYSAGVFVSIEVGESRPTQVWAWCSIAIEVGEDRYLSDSEIVPYPGRDWRTSDFPPEWDVVVFNDAGSDGPSWVVLDAKVTRIDESTLEVRHIGTDTLISNFVLDETPFDERIMC